MATPKDLGYDNVSKNGRPIFIATEPSLFAPSVTRELTNQEQMAWRSFQLWRTTLAMERRDKSYQSIVTSPYTNFHLAHELLGTPFPVVEPHPTLTDGIKNVRPYEHVVSALVGIAYRYWLRSKPSIRLHSSTTTPLFTVPFATFILCDVFFVQRSVARLAGFSPNDYECRKYGVVEDKARLERKKEQWEKFAQYKREWCKRYDYHTFGIRPGENWNLFSACWLPMWPPRYGTITDYPMRKNPYVLSTKPVKDMAFTGPSRVHIPRDDNVLLVAERPELKHIYTGPNPPPPPPPTSQA